MTTNIVTTLIAGAMLVGSATACLQTTDASLGSAPVSARAESAASGGALVVAVVPPAHRFTAAAGGFTHRAPQVVLLTSRPSSAAD